MKANLAFVLAFALVDSLSAQATFYAMYKMFSSQDTFCGGSYQNVYNSDLNEARISGNDNSISSSKCFKNTQGQYVIPTCDSTSGVETFSTYASPGCSGLPYQVSTTAPGGGCIFWNNPPLIYMGCTSDEKSAISQGYKDVNTVNSWILVSKRVACSACFGTILIQVDHLEILGLYMSASSTHVFDCMPFGVSNLF
jgi:hypothetical protein